MENDWPDMTAAHTTFVLTNHSKIVDTFAAGPPSKCLVSLDGPPVELRDGVVKQQPRWARPYPTAEEIEIASLVNRQWRKLQPEGS